MRRGLGFLFGLLLFECELKYDMYVCRMVGGLGVLQIVFCDKLGARAPFLGAVNQRDV